LKIGDNFPMVRSNLRYGIFQIDAKGIRRLRDLAAKSMFGHEWEIG